MTDEAKKYMYQGLLLGLENGLEPDEFFSNNLENARRNGTLVSSLEEIQELDKKMNRSEDFGNFVRDFFEKIQNVESVLYSDTYFRTNTQNSEFLNCLNGIKDQFKGFRDFVGAYRAFNTSNEILADNETLRKEAQRQRVGIKLDKNLSPLEKSLKLAEANALYGDRSSSVKEYIEARNEQERKTVEFLSSALNGLDRGAFLENCRININNLDSLSKNLAIADPETRDKLGVTIRELRDVLIRFRNEYLSYEAKYNEILHQIGFKKSDASTELIEANIARYKQEIADLEKSEDLSDELDASKEAPEVKPEEVEVVKEEVPAVEPTPEIVEEPKQEITTLEELISELQKLNPDIEVIRDGDTDGILTDDPANLVIPEGFKYTEGIGVNNKKNDVDPYISAFVKTRDRDLGGPDAPSMDEPVETEPEKTEEKEEVKEETKSEPQKEKAESRVPGGRLSIKRTRRAIIAPYAKAVLCYGALGAVLTAMAGVGLAPILPVAAITAGVGMVGQKIYNKLVDRGVLDVPGAKYEAPDYELPVVGSYIIQDAKKLLQCLRDHKAKKQEAEREDVEPEFVDEMSEVVEEKPTAPSVDEVFEEVKDYEETPELVDEMPEVAEEKSTAPSVDEVVKEVKGYEETPDVLAENEMEMHNIDDIVKSETPEYSEQAVFEALEREKAKKMESIGASVVPEEDKKSSLYDNFRSALGKELDEEVASLSNVPSDSQNIQLQPEVPELDYPQYELPEYLNEQYWIKENPEESMGRGGR